MQKELMTNFAQKEILLHQQLNSDKTKDFVSLHESYQQFFNLTRVFTEQTSQFIGGNKENMRAIYDNATRNFSEKKQGDDYLTQFSLYASIHQGEGTETEDIGYVELHFQIRTKKALREMANKEIFRCWIDENKKEILFTVYNHSQLQVIQSHYEECYVKISEPILYKSKQPGFMEMK